MPSEPSNDGEEEEDEVAAASVLNLPSREHEGVWDSLVYEPGVKDTLLGHADATLAFSDAGVDSNIVTCNRSALSCPSRSPRADLPPRAG